MEDKNEFKNKERGFVALAFILMVNAITIAVSAGIFLRSISVSNNSFYEYKSAIAESIVFACGEYSTMKFSTTSSGWLYGGDETFLLGDNSCYIYPIVASGTSKLIKATSTVSGFTRKILIEVATNTPSILVNSWTEVADF